MGDHILSDVAPDAGSGSRNGSPSDHPLVKGSFTLSSGQATTAPPTSTSRGNDESCTEEEKDPYASGQNVQCCTGLQSCLGAWSARAAGITSARDRASHGGPSWAGNGLLSKPTAISNSSSESLEFVLCTATCA